MKGSFVVAHACPRVSLQAIAAFMSVLSTGCLVDKGRCGPHQELNVGGNCVCETGYVPDERLVCRACGENQRSVGDRCECAAGFTRDTNQACVPQGEGVGATCASSEECLASVPYCLQKEAGSGYCTVSGCEHDDQCPGGYACDVSASPAVCVRPPSGQGDPCTKQEDCAGKEASYCETLSSNRCLVANCTADTDCTAGWACCDLTVFGLPALCVTEGSCPVP